MTLRTFEPTPTWDPDAHEETVAAFAALAATDATVTLWCRDDCPDCRRELPDLAAALRAAAFPDDRLRLLVVDDDNVGELTDEYDVAAVPTVVVERDGEALARFEERAALPAPEALAADLRDAGVVE